MAENFVIPNLGENIEKATIARWLVEDGAGVQAGDDVLELETDKAVIPVPADISGIIHPGPFQAGDAVTVGQTVAQIEAASTPQRELIATPQTEPAVEAPQTESVAVRPKATPVAQKIAADLGVNLNAVTGRGEQSRITKADVLEAAVPAPQTESVAVPPADDVLQSVPLKGIRGVIARRMAESVHSTARVTLMTEVDATEFVAMRAQLKAKYTADWGFAPGYNDLLALIVANALREFPYMNARLSADGSAIEQLKPVNLGLAVDTDRGLVVTVIRDADRKGLREFGADFRELVDRARAGKSLFDDLTGGTFTITNLGMYRVDAFTPVINLPEAAILGVGRITPKPVACGDEVVIRKMMTLSLVMDHRLNDGAPTARFLDYICEVIEEPSLLFLTKR
jgi:pyruvate dehydrogenase E2 component (dihydrolipoamide acetyltransferase)